MAQKKQKGRHVPFWSSLQAKFALAYIVVIAAAIALLNTYPVLGSRDLVISSKMGNLKSQASLMASNLATLERLSLDNRDRVERVIGDLPDVGLGRIVVTDPAGLTLYDSGGPGSTVGHYAIFGEVTTALKDNGYDVFRCEYRDGAFRSRAAAPVVHRNVVLGAVYLYEYDTAQGALLLGMQKNLRNLSMVICLVAVISSLAFSRVLTRRLDALLRAITIVRRGEYSHRVGLGGHDELSLLSDEFDQLTGRLQTTEEARRRFVSDASHELKTPLASIRLLTDSILQSREMDPETAREFVSDIGEEAERLTRITEKLLTLTRTDMAQSIGTEVVDVKYVVEKVQRMLTPLARAVDVTVECALNDYCFILCTQDDLYQIAFNLMENAVKYNLPGGKVLVDLRREEETGEGPQVVLTIEDTGVGIPEEDLPKIFDRFYRVDKARSRAAGGTGLGLSIVRDTALHHGGSVMARSRAPAPGACFTVSFPAIAGGEGGTR